MRLFFLHIDTLYFSAIPRDEKKFSKILKMAEIAKELGEKFYNGYRVLPGYKNWQCGYVNEFGVWVNIAVGKKLGDAFPLYFRVPAEVLLQYHKCLDKLLQDCGKDFGGFTVTKISRIDITVDTDECTVTPSWVSKLDWKAFNANWVESGKVEEKITYYIQDNPFLKHVGFTGITAGSGLSECVYFRCYAKIIEMKRHKGNLEGFLNVVREYGYSLEDGKPIWRFEWEMKRDFLKNFGLDTVEETFRSLQKLFCFLTTQWMDVDHCSRSRITRFWSKLQKLKFQNQGGEVLERISKINVSQLEAQLIGVLARIFEENRCEKKDMPHYVASLIRNNEEKLFRWQQKKKKVKRYVFGSSFKAIVRSVIKAYEDRIYKDRINEQKKEARLEASEVC